MAFDLMGNLADVVLGFDSLEPYLKGAAPYFGCIVGRVANRIRDGKFTRNGVDYSLPINKPPNSLHGGHKGFDKVIWDVVEQKKGDNPSITFKYQSHDGEEGYPGDLSVSATYTLTSKTTLRLDMEAVPKDKTTPVSLAQHTYWNLAGHKPFHPNMGNSNHTGYDHNYVLDCGEEKDGLKRAARLKDPSSSRVLNLWTNAPRMQFYTANYVNGVVGKGGATY
ncbi:Galactose mutarotase-like superfamily protein [Euphorbia peplus]|nr:Galactose mutarotase-like superfamily protein [Euphorbia peplus]